MHATDDPDVAVEDGIGPGADLRGRDLRGVNLGRLDLAGADLTEADLRDADLTGASLVGACLHGADLRGARFLHADLTGADLSVANAADAALGGATLDRAVVFGSDLSNASLSHASLRGADLRTTRFGGARLIGADLADADLSRADLSGADMTDAAVDGASFHDASMSATVVRGIRGAEHADWVGASFSSADFTGAYLARREAIDQNYLHEFRRRGRMHEWLYRLWWVTSDCGRSFVRWGMLTVLFALVFGGVYSFVEIDYGGHETSISSVYFSVVTLTTLGYGDVVPASQTAQIVVMLEVVLGYVMLGGLLSIFATKMGRRGE
ncbi:MAG: pentapeptide repeat-containing protein [Acidimicrobiales bacterium]